MLRWFGSQNKTARKICLHLQHWCIVWDFVDVAYFTSTAQVYTLDWSQIQWQFNSNSIQFNPEAASRIQVDD